MKYVEDSSGSIILLVSNIELLIHCVLKRMKNIQESHRPLRLQTTTETLHWKVFKLDYLKLLNQFSLVKNISLTLY